ncbi:TVP38/TMEM64 family protein [Paenibacillaceae bacterium WGS1546]|uniref:TVP38/TMEM64 family protein n=1 Tax=Cohnella sp. WGS1546 TaxID=3366810 RepID=UPI00372D4BBB
MIGAAILLAAVPAIPFGIVAGIMGAQYGPVWGTLINVATSAIAAALQFLAVRVLFQKQGRQFVTKFKRIEHFILFLERNAFLAVITTRLLPFVPAPVINVAAAISPMSFGSFFLATVMGKFPVMVLFSILGDKLLFSSVSGMMWALLIYALFLMTVYAGYRWLYMTKLSKPDSEE